jgi:2-methylcitrate dehydratase PrpD
VVGLCTLPTGRAGAGALRPASLPLFPAARGGDPQVRDLAARVTFEVDPEIEAIYPTAMPAKVRVRTTDGRVLEHAVDGPTGSPFRPYTMDDVARKVRRLAEGVLDPARAEAALERIAGLEGLADVRELTGLLAG